MVTFNFNFVLYVLLFAVFVFFTGNGIIILRVKCFRHPLRRDEFIEGRKAVAAGVFLILLGLYSLIVLVVPSIPKDLIHYLNF